MSVSAPSNSDCPLCNFSSPSRSLWLSHLRSVHSDDSDFLVTCGIDGCELSYSKCSSLVSHIYRHHRSSIICQDVDVASSNKENRLHCEQDCFDGLSSTYYEEPFEEPDLQHTIDQLLNLDGVEQQRKAALFILNLKEVCGLSQLSVDRIVKETQNVYNHTLGRIKAGVHECLSKSSIENDVLNNDLERLFSDVKDPFHGLHSTYLQECFYRCNLGCLVRVTYNIHKIAP